MKWGFWNPGFKAFPTNEQGPRHGYGIMQDVEADTRGRLTIGPGTLYSAIKRLRQDGLVDECRPDAARRRCYRLSRKGRRAAKAEAHRLSMLVRVADERGLLAPTS